MLRRWVACLLAVVPLAALSGCVERRMTIVTDPPGATVFVNGQRLGASPVDVPSRSFLYYGKYHIQLYREGYEPMRVEQDIPAPWYQWPVIDFVAENLVPWHIQDHRILPYTMLPVRQVPSEDILRNAEIERGRSRGIGLPPE